MRHAQTAGAFMVVTVLLAVSAPRAFGAPASIWDDLIRGTTRVTEKVPLQSAEDLAKRLGKSKAAREAVEAELKAAGKAVHGVDDAARAASRSEHVLAVLRRATADCDPTLLRRLEALDDAARESALVYARGGRRVADAVPDLAARGRFLREGGPPTVAAIGLYGDDIAHAALRLDSAIQNGSLVLRQGQRAVKVADLGEAFTRYGQASHTFFTRYIQPHWKLWLAGGALAAWLIDPQAFQDAVGGLTEAGAKRLTELLGTAAAATVRGVGQGSGEAVTKTGRAIWDTYFAGWRGLAAGIGTVLLFGLLFPRTRRHLLRPLRWLCRPPANPASAPPRANQNKEQKETP